MAGSKGGKRNKISQNFIARGAGSKWGKTQQDITECHASLTSKNLSPQQSRARTPKYPEDMLATKEEDRNMDKMQVLCIYRPFFSKDVAANISSMYDNIVRKMEQSAKIIKCGGSCKAYKQIIGLFKQTEQKG